MTNPLSTKKKSTKSQELRRNGTPYRWLYASRWNSATRHAAMPRQLSNTTNRSMFATNALRRRRRLLAKLEQLGSDLLHGRCSERDTASETPQVSRVPDLSSAHEVGKTDAGKVVYFDMSHLERVAAPQQIGVGKGGDCNVDSLAAVGPTRKK